MIEFKSSPDFVAGVLHLFGLNQQVFLTDIPGIELPSSCKTTGR
ncbi:hypothetical protein HDF11_003693 [Tunturiibacter psychrotolerans]